MLFSKLPKLSLTLFSFHSTTFLLYSVLVNNKLMLITVYLPEFLVIIYSLNRAVVSWPEFCIVLCVPLHPSQNVLQFQDLVILVDLWATVAATFCLNGWSKIV